MDRLFQTAIVSFALTATGLPATTQQAQAQARRAEAATQVTPRGGAVARARVLATQYLQQPELTRRYTRTLFVQPLKERIVRETGYALLLEGESADALVKASRAAPR